MSRNNLYCEIGSYCLDEFNFFWSRIWLKFRPNDFLSYDHVWSIYYWRASFHIIKTIQNRSLHALLLISILWHFLTANFHKRKIINGLSRLSKNSAITKADINWHTIIRPRDQWKLLQCGLRTRHLPSFFVPTAGHLTSQMSQPPGISHPRKKEVLMPRS